MSASKKIFFLFASVFLLSTTSVKSGLKQVLTPERLKALSLVAGDAFMFYAGCKHSARAEGVADLAAISGIFFYIAPTGYDVLTLPSDQEAKHSVWKGAALELVSLLCQCVAFYCCETAGRDFHSWKKSSDCISLPVSMDFLEKMVFELFVGGLCNVLGHCARERGTAQLSGTSLNVEVKMSNAFAEKMKPQDESTMTELVKNQN